MIIYIDETYKCHAEASQGRTAVETDAFEGKCQAYIEGCRYVPAGQTWTREDGAGFYGEMLCPWRDYNELDVAQREYERQQLEDMRAALALLGVTE